MFFRLCLSFWEDLPQSRHGAKFMGHLAKKLRACVPGWLGTLIFHGKFPYVIPYGGKRGGREYSQGRQAASLPY
jgi:hypothetical protein